MAEPAAAPTKTGLKRRRIAVGSSEQYDETTSRLGAGGFGSVVRARHRATDRPVAIKRLVVATREARFLEDASAGNPYVVGFQGVVATSQKFNTKNYSSLKFIFKN
jgi:cell division cycle 2-like protein